MTFDEVFEGFKTLAPAEQNRLVDAARQFLRLSNSCLTPGARVRFRYARTGATIEGTFVRMKQKYAEIASNFDRYGVRHPTALRWNVPPEQLTPVEG